MINPRRIFLLQVAVTGGAVLGCGRALAEVRKKIDENEPKAVTLGYRHDTGKVDAARFPKHTASEKCGSCMAYLGTPADAWGDCDLMGDRAVSANGWCSSFVRGR